MWSSNSLSWIVSYKGGAVEGRPETGVEMDAFTAVVLCPLTSYDMCKSLERGITISAIRFIKKIGAKSGEFIRPKHKE